MEGEIQSRWERGRWGWWESGVAAKRLREKPSRLEKTENKICLLGGNYKNKIERRVTGELQLEVEKTMYKQMIEHRKI